MGPEPEEVDYNTYDTDDENTYVWYVYVDEFGGEQEKKVSAAWFEWRQQMDA